MGSKNKVKWANRYNEYRNNQKEREILLKKGGISKIKRKRTIHKKKHLNFQKGDSLKNYGYDSLHLFELTIPIKK